MPVVFDEVSAEVQPPPREEGSAETRPDSKPKEPALPKLREQLCRLKQREARLRAD